MQVGLTAVMQTIQLVVPIMQRQGGGTIINTSSVAGLFADAGTAAYNTVKAGVINLTRAVALERAQRTAVPRKDPYGPFPSLTSNGGRHRCCSMSSRAALILGRSATAG